MADSISFKEFLANNPIAIFSLDSFSQVEVLRDLSNCIADRIDACVRQDGERVMVDAHPWKAAYGDFWLWVLGAYEVTRTMSAAKGCFSPTVTQSLAELKITLAEIRIPFAKQERRGRREHAGMALSVAGFDVQPPDFKFKIGGTTVSCKNTIAKFNKTMDSIRVEDVLADHRSNYSSGR